MGIRRIQTSDSKNLANHQLESKVGGEKRSGRPEIRKPSVSGRWEKPRDVEKTPHLSRPRVPGVGGGFYIRMPDHVSGEVVMVLRKFRIDPENNIRRGILGIRYDRTQEWVSIPFALFKSVAISSTISCPTFQARKFTWVFVLKIFLKKII